VDALSYKTIFLNKNTVKKDWFIIDAKNQTLGRLCAKVAYMLRGKHKVGYTPHTDCGDNIVVINAAHIRLTGKKWSDKEYDFYSGYPGGLRWVKAKDLIKRRPTYLVEEGIRGMLPKTRLGKEMFRNLRVYADDQHKHSAQQPTEIQLNTIK